MYRPEAQIANSEINQGLDNLFQTPVQQQMGDAALAYGAEQKRMDSLTRQQISDGQLPDAQIHDSAAGKFSDAPPNSPVLDAQGRVQSINYADGTSRQFTYKDGHVDTYKDRDGHTWKFTPPDIWTQQDGKSVLHGEMIVDKDGSFTFINHDKNYVSHYGADGKENLSARKKYDEYTNEEFLALEIAGKQFAATGLPQESVEKKKKDSTTASTEKPSDPAIGEGGQSPERPGAGGPDSPHPEEPGEDVKPAPETKPETGEAEKPAPETKPETGEAEKPAPETKPETGEAEKPAPETKPETSEAEKPAPETKPETGEDVKPAPETKPETGEVEKPAPETKPETGEAEKPTPETKPETGEAEKPAPEEPTVVAAQDGAVMPLTATEVQSFARNFQMDPSEVARIGSLTLEQVRAEMQAIPASEHVNNQKYRFYGEMVYRLTDGKSSSAYTSSNFT